PQPDRVAARHQQRHHRRLRGPLYGGRQLLQWSVLERQRGSDVLLDPDGRAGLPKGRLHRTAHQRHRDPKRPLQGLAILAGDRDVAARDLPDRPHPERLLSLAGPAPPLGTSHAGHGGQGGPLMGSLDGVRRQDALRQAASARLASAFPVRVNRGEASLVAILAIFSLALALLPNPMDQVLAQRQADRTSQAKAAKAVQAAQKKVADNAKPTPIDPEVQRILQDAQAKIREAGGPRKALETITPAEQQLRRLTDPGTPALSSSAQNLANALSG